MAKYSCPVCSSPCESPDGCFRHKKKKKIRKKKKTMEQVKEIESRYEKDWAFYNEIWNERPHYCTNCGNYLGSTPLSTYFDHILEKQAYPEFRYAKWNIRLLDGDCHGNRHNIPRLLIQDKIVKEMYVD